VAHPSGELTPYGPAVLVKRVVVHGWSVGEAAEAASVSAAAVDKWLRPFGEEGPPGLEDRSSAPHRRPRSLPRSEVRRIVARTPAM
jgi:hypothetical protein